MFVPRTDGTRSQIDAVILRQKLNDLIPAMTEKDVDIFNAFLTNLPKSCNGYDIFFTLCIKLKPRKPLMHYFYTV